MWFCSLLWLGALITSALAIAIAPASKLAVPNCALIVQLVTSARHSLS